MYLATVWSWPNSLKIYSVLSNTVQIGKHERNVIKVPILNNKNMTKLNQQETENTTLSEQVSTLEHNKQWNLTIYPLFSCINILIVYWLRLFFYNLNTRKQWFISETPVETNIILIGLQSENYPMFLYIRRYFPLSPNFNVQKAQTASIYKRSNARTILLSGHSETGGNKQFRIFSFQMM